MLQYLLWYGRLNRQKFILIHLLLGLMILVSMEYLTANPSWNVYTHKLGYEPALVCGFMVYLPLTWILFCCQIRRYHDLNKSGLNILWFNVPLINLYWTLRLVFEKGTPGPNKYGEDRCMP